MVTVADAPASALATAGPGSRAERRDQGVRSSGLVDFVVAFSLYFVAGWQLAITHHAIVGDAMARVANGSYVLFSRDPHLAAVGFVWNPLPSLASLPLLGLSGWWPDLKRQAFAGNIVSAAFMAGSVVVIRRIFDELRVTRWVSWALLALFALHPMIVLYGANGDSEAPLVFFLSLACLGVLRWIDRRDLRSLMVLGLALGLGYLSRQEFLAAGAISIGVVLVMTYRSTAGVRPHRRRSAVLEATIAGLPLVFSIVCWAGSAIVIVGTATAYLSVNAEQVSANQSGIASVVGGYGASARFAYFLGQLLILEPVWSVIVLGAIVLSVRRRDARILAPLATFGAVLAAQGVLFTNGSTFGWLRFAITVIPLTIVSAAIASTHIRDLSEVERRRHARRRSRDAARFAITVALIGGGVFAIPRAVTGMTNPRWGREEAAMVRLLPGYGWAGSAPSAYAPGWLDGFDPAARYFSNRSIPDGSVLTDVQYSFPMVLKSARPRQFVIPSDADFERDVADPATFRIRYLVISNGPNDVLAENYPTFGSGRNRRIAVGRFVRDFRTGAQTLSVYRVTRSVTGSRVSPEQRPRDEGSAGRRVRASRRPFARNRGTVQLVRDRHPAVPTTDRHPTIGPDDLDRLRSDTFDRPPRHGRHHRDRAHAATNVRPSTG